MRILHVAWTISNPAGVPRYVRSIATVQQALGNDVLVAAGDGDLYAPGEQEAPLAVATVPRLREAFHASRGEPARPGRRENSESLTELVRRFRPDVVVAHEPARYSSDVAKELMTLPDSIRVVSTMHMTSTSGFLPEVTRLPFDHHFLVSEATRSLLPPGAPATSGWIGIDTQEFHPSLDDSLIDQRLVKLAETHWPLFFHPSTRPHPEKGHDDLREAAPLIKEEFPDAGFVMSGTRLRDRHSGPYLDWLNRFMGSISSSPFASSFFFPEFESHRMAHAHRAVARTKGAVVHPSLKEAFGLAIMEALACDAYVVATEIEGQVDALDAGRVGLLVPPGNVQALAEGSIRAVKDSSWRSGVSLARPNHVRKYSLRETVVPRMLDAYAALLEQPSRRNSQVLSATKLSLETDR